MGTQLRTIIWNTSRMKLFLVLITVAIIVSGQRPRQFGRPQPGERGLGGFGSGGQRQFGPEEQEGFGIAGPPSSNNLYQLPSRILSLTNPRVNSTGPGTCSSQNCCQLMTAVKTVQTGNGRISGELCSDCPLYNNSPGGVIAVITSDGPVECNEECVKLPRCLFWTMNDNAGVCWLFGLTPQFPEESRVIRAKDGKEVPIFVSGVRCEKKFKN